MTHSENPGQPPYLKIINLITPQRLFSKKVTFTGFKNQDQTSLGEHYQKCIKNVKYLVLNIREDVQDLDNENHKTLLREIKINLNKWKDVSFS